MSLHTMVIRGIRRRAPGVDAMSVLETALALGAIATAVLLNLAR